jgi:hypothetical protein
MTRENQRFIEILCTFSVRYLSGENVYMLLTSFNKIQKVDILLKIID